MGLFSKDIKTLDDLFVHTLQDIYYAENQIAKALPEMAEKATDPQLKQAFKSHLDETKQQIKMVEQVFRMHGQEPKGVTCPAIDGIIDEAQELAGEVDDKEVLDAALIAAAQAVEHYEMTRYGTLCRLGEAARPPGLRHRPARDLRAGESDRREAVEDRRRKGQQEGRRVTAER